MMRVVDREGTLVNRKRLGLVVDLESVLEDVNTVHSANGATYSFDVSASRRARQCHSSTGGSACGYFQ